MCDGSSSGRTEDDFVESVDLRAFLLDIFCPKRCDHSRRHEQKESSSGQGTGSASCEPSSEEDLGDPYEVLQIAIGASLAEIRRAYRRLALLYHPDKNNGNPNALRQFLNVQRAFDKLMAEQRQHASSNQESQADDDEEDEEAKEQQRKKDNSELERQFRAEHKRFQRKAAKELLPKGRDRRQKNAKARTIPNEVYAEFAFSKHDVAVAIRYKYHMILRSLLDDIPLDEDLGRGSSALHFAAHHGDERAAMLIMSLAGRQWFRLVEAVNDDGLTAAAVGIKFHPDARLTSMLLAWEEQAEDAESAYLYEESRVIDWASVVVILLWLMCAWYCGFRAVAGGTAFTVSFLVESSFQDKPLALCPSLAIFIASNIFFHIEVSISDAMLELVGEAGKVIAVCAAYGMLLMQGPQFTFASASDLRSILCFWAVLHGWHGFFPSAWSIWKWLFAVSLEFYIGNGVVIVFILQGLVVRDMIACGEQLAIAVCISNVISENRATICRLCKHTTFASLWNVMQRSLGITSKCTDLVPVGQFVSPSKSPIGGKAGPSTDSRKTCESSGNQDETRQARIRDHQLLIANVEERQTEHGQELVMQRLRQNQGQAEQEAQALRKQDEAAQEAERKKQDQRRHEEEKLQREREHAKKELEKLLAHQGNVNDFKTALGAARRSNLKLAGYSNLVAAAERRMYELEQLEAEVTRREKERVASLRRAEAEEKQRMETERRRRILEEERLKKAEEKRLKEALARERKEQEQQRKDEEQRRKKEELEAKQMQAQKLREEQQRIKEETRKRKKEEKEAKDLEARALEQKLQRKAQEEQVSQQLEAHRRSEEIKARLAQKAKRRQNESTQYGRLQTSRESHQHVPSPSNKSNPSYAEAFSPCSDSASTLTPVSSGSVLPVSPCTSQSPQRLSPPSVPPCFAEERKQMVRTSGLVSEPIPFEAIATFRTANSGYMSVHPGLWILVLYWQEADEYEPRGWAYGKVLGDDSNQGWLPQRVLDLTDGGCS